MTQLWTSRYNILLTIMYSFLLYTEVSQLGVNGGPCSALQVGPSTFNLDYLTNRYVNAISTTIDT